MWLIDLSINRPVFVLMIELFLMVLGLIGYQKIGVDLYPKIDPPIITITTQYPGAGPEEVESLVSKPIEEEVNQIGGIDRLTSTSREGNSQVVIEFKLEIDAKQAQIEVQNKLSRIRTNLPRDIEEPLIQRLDFSDRPVLTLALKSRVSGDVKSEVPLYVPESRLRLLADHTIKQRLQKVDGIGEIKVFGGLEREVNIELDLQKMLLWKITPGMVADAVKAANLNIPAGEIREEPRRRAIRLLGQYETITEIENTIVKALPGGRAIRIADIGTARDTYKDRETIARLNQTPVVLLEVKKQSDANTVEVVDNLKKVMPKLNSQIPSGIELLPVFDGTKKIRASLYDVMETMVIAAVLAFLVVYCFLGSFQSTFITGIALPMTVIATFFVLYILGFTLNIMTLLGLTLCVGLILDDAIVVRENIWNKIEEGMPPKLAAREGSREVFVAVLATSLTILATFFPVTLIPGVTGKFFSAFALTVCLAVILSTFDALTMAPMLSAYLMTEQKPQGEHKKNRMLEWMEYHGGRFSAQYEKALRWSLSNKKKVLGSAALLFVVVLWMGKFIGFTFLPNEENGEMEISFEAPAGSSILKADLIASEMEKKLKEFPEVDYTTSRMGNEFKDPNLGIIYVKLFPKGPLRKRGTGTMKIAIRKALASMALQEKLDLTIRDAGGGGGGKKPVSFAILGTDYFDLGRLSLATMEKATLGIPEIVNLESSMKPGRGELQFHVDRPRLAEYGLTTQDVGRSIRGMFEGELAGKYREAGEEYDLRVRLRPQDRFGVNSLNLLTIPNVRNEAVPLSAVTVAGHGVSPTKFIRIDQQRAAKFEGDLEQGAPLATAIQKVKAMVEPMLPVGYSLGWQGQAESLRDLTIGAIVAFGLGIVFIYMIMASLYESFILPFAILLTLPLAIVGALIAFLVTGKLLDIYGVIGIILLMGLVCKNAILLVDYVEQLRARGESRMTALVDAGVRRLRPIMMTTVAMIVGMLPVAIGYGELNQARSGMGIGCIGGLISSTLLSLIVVPCAYLYLDDFRVWAGAFVRRYYGASPVPPGTALES